MSENMIHALLDQTAQARKEFIAKMNVGEYMENKELFEILDKTEKFLLCQLA